MSFSVLCRQVIDWHKKGKVDVFPGGGTLVSEGPASIAFNPGDDPDCIVKVIKPGQKPHGLSIGDEVKLMETIQKLEGELFVTPHPLSHGENPDYIAMGFLGESFAKDAWNGRINSDTAKRIGAAVGEFAGHLFLKHGSIHEDICANNYTMAPNEKIGIIDIAAIEKTNIPEKMFLTPLLDPINICPAMAEKFEQVTGRPIDFDLVEQLSTERLLHLLPSHPAEIAATIQSRHSSNLEEWRRLRSEEKTSHRPVAARKVINPRRDR